MTSDKRMTALPDVPTAEEAGLKGYQTGAWFALLGPAGMPKPIVDKLYAAMADAVKDPDVLKRLTEQGAEPSSPGPDHLKKFIASELVKQREIIQKAGVEPMLTGSCLSAEAAQRPRRGSAFVRPQSSPSLPRSFDRSSASVFTAAARIFRSLSVKAS